ncbi:MAG: 16S rRNA (adenine(1518)-N(6)/adenine(1519)-N(6))-dimethyltransferase RsmA [Candidatus Aerophobetes bacterium]|nr:16S rRNA (adenine(1518)-N(6)/adenine(1519)-N(6))-dimethyltransferase RsmA [Candidatus Aerophobetes bacterium]
MKLKDKVEYLWYKYNFTPKREIGQNFLIDPRIIERIMKTLKVAKEDTILEIGAGTGVLTEKLVRKGGKVIAVEVDKNLCEMLKKELEEYLNLKVICEDITQISFDEEFKQAKSVKLAGNLPYYIASSILLDMVKKDWIKFMVVMVQREMAERLLAKPGNKRRGKLTVLMNYYGDGEKIIDVPPQAFIPPPKVGATLLKIEKSKRYRAKDENNFFSVVEAAFSSRRKMLANSLSKSLGINKDLIKEKLETAGINWKERAEDLREEEFISISNNLGVKNAH